MESHTNQRERPELLAILVAFLVINALVTGIHFQMIFMGVIPVKADIDSITEIALADILVTVIPSLIAAYGLWGLKRWAWMLTMIVSGGYFHGMILLLTRSVILGRYGSMTFVSLYFLLFTIVLVLYLWKERHIFRAEQAAA